MPGPEGCQSGKKVKAQEGLPQMQHWAGFGSLLIRSLIPQMQDKKVALFPVAKRLTSYPQVLSFSHPEGSDWPLSGRLLYKLKSAGLFLPLEWL